MVQITLTVDEIAERMMEQRSPDDILDELNPSSEQLVEALFDLIIEKYEELNERYGDDEYRKSED